MKLPVLEDANLADKFVLVRLDLNVPIKDGVIQDTTRIDKSLETLNYVLQKGAKKIVIMSHLGRPKLDMSSKNSIKNEKDKFSLAPVGSYLAEKLNKEVYLTEWAVDCDVKRFLSLNPPQILLLENLRFHKEEKANDSEFANKLAEYADVYITDAFGTLHRKHASTYGILKYFPNKSFVGKLIEKEVHSLEKIITQPKRPFVALMGGAKITDKIKILEKLLQLVDNIIIGGAMAYPFLKAKGYNIGQSLCNEEDLKKAKAILKTHYAPKILLPEDHRGTIKGQTSLVEVHTKDMPEDFVAQDIGPQTVQKYLESLKGAQTIFWNGPMGLFENPHFAKGTIDIAKGLAKVQAFKVVGGGDSVSCVKNNNLEASFSHLSTGGGASLEFLENSDLPGLRVLRFGF